jgi:hypothetical protein
MHRLSCIHRITAWMALIGYALVASGLPLPMGAVAPAASDSPAAKRLAVKDRSRPFPCMDKPCGCATAEQCFSNCCCNTPAELVAWAKANRIDPAVIVALTRRAAAPAPQASCCSTAAKTSCCAEAAKPSCCESQSPKAPEPEAMPVSAETVVLRAMLACGGIVAEWLAVGIALPPPSVVACDRSTEPIASLILVDEVSLSERIAPDGPPPRSA